ncbi:MAG: hypothetical protein H5T64_08665 [Chloroflexi bacterium]|nr:hypothetical protein [Chloroflexota bacterium]
MNPRHLILPILLLAIGCQASPGPTALPITPTAPAPGPFPSLTPAPPGGTLIVGLDAAVDSLDPAAAYGAASHIARCLYDTLVDVDTKGRIRPALATSWVVSPQGDAWTFTIRPDVHFHDGHTLTAADVAHTFRRLTEDTEQYGWPDPFAIIRSVRAIGDSTVVFTLTRPCASFAEILADPRAGIVPADSGDSLAEHPVGTGPFRFAGWVRDDYVRLVRNEDYYQGPGVPALAEVIFRILPNAEVRAKELERGAIDVALAIAPERVPTLAQNGFVIRPVPLGAVVMLAINHARPPFDDPRVRQALCYAVDRALLVREAEGGYGYPVVGPLPPSSPFYQDFAARYPPDLWKARMLLAEAHVNLRVSILAARAYPAHVRAAQVVASQLGQVGIQATVQELDWATFSRRVFGDRDYDLALVGHTARLAPESMLWRYASDSPDNYSGYGSTDYDALVAKAGALNDTLVRAQVYEAMQSQLLDDAVAVFLYAPAQVTAHRATVLGLEAGPVDGYDLRTVRYAEPPAPETPPPPITEVPSPWPTKTEVAPPVLTETMPPTPLPTATAPGYPVATGTITPALPTAPPVPGGYPAPETPAYPPPSSGQ